MGRNSQARAGDLEAMSSCACKCQAKGCATCCYCDREFEPVSEVETKLAIAKEGLEDIIRVGSYSLKRPAEMELIVGSMQRRANDTLQKLKEQK